VKRPTRRRSAGAPTVDCASLLSFIMRRCEGYPPDYYFHVATNFFDATDFSDEVRETVFKMMKERLSRKAKTPSVTAVPAIMNGSVVCGGCGKRIELHPQDEAQPHLTKLCTGQLVRVV